MPWITTTIQWEAKQKRFFVALLHQKSKSEVKNFTKSIFVRLSVCGGPGAKELYILLLHSRGKFGGNFVDNFRACAGKGGVFWPEAAGGGSRRGDVSTIPDATLRIQFSCRSGTVASRGRPRHVTLLLYGAKIHPEQSCIAAGTLESLFLILQSEREKKRGKHSKMHKRRAGDITQKSNSLSWPTYIFCSFFMHPILYNLYIRGVRNFSPNTTLPPCR